MRASLCAAIVAVTCALPLSAASVDGLRLHWSVTGQGKKTVVLVHGWTCDSTSWSSQVTALSRKYRVVTLDLPGHGRSQSPRDGRFSMDLFARAVESVRREVGASRIVLAGHSMGTPVIRQYAREYPSRVAGLVLVDGLVSLPPGTVVLQADALRGPGGLKARQSMIRGMFTPDTPAPLQKRITAMMLRPPGATAAGAMAATFAATSSDDVMTMPVLGIYADRSPLANRDYMKKIFPELEYVEIPGTGHFLMMEKPKAFNRLISAFLDKLAY